jgi:hypothetical protein
MAYIGELQLFSISAIFMSNPFQPPFIQNETREKIRCIRLEQGVGLCILLVASLAFLYPYVLPGLMGLHVLGFAWARMWKYEQIANGFAREIGQRPQVAGGWTLFFMSLLASVGLSIAAWAVFVCICVPSTVFELGLMQGVTSGEIPIVVWVVTVAICYFIACFFQWVLTRWTLPHSFPIESEQTADPVS